MVTVHQTYQIIIIIIKDRETKFCLKVILGQLNRKS